MPLAKRTARWLRRFPAVILAAGIVVAAVWLPSGQASAAPVHARVHAARHAAARPKVVVTFAWGGGLADQMASLPIFRKYGMRATYFVPSGLGSGFGRGSSHGSRYSGAVAEAMKLKSSKPNRSKRIC